MSNYANNFHGFSCFFLFVVAKTGNHMYREQGPSKLSKLSAMNGFSGARVECVRYL